MSFTSIFLLLVFGLVLLFIGLSKLLNTSAARIFLINWKMQQKEKEKKREIDKFRYYTYEQAKNPDQILELILKIKKGEKVDIPLAAFSYIYKNLNKFTIIDKAGNLRIMNYEKFQEFKDTSK